MFLNLQVLTFLLSHFFILSLDATWEEVPTSYNGRIMPLGPAINLWYHELYHGSAPEDFVWNLHFFGHTFYDDTPLFWISSAPLKKELQLPLEENRFSYNQLKQRNIKEATLLQKIKEYEGGSSEATLFQDRLKNGGFTYKVLPSRYQKGLFYSLKTLSWGDSNFTLYPDALFEEIKALYSHVSEGVLRKEDISPSWEELGKKLLEGYTPLSGLPIQEGKLHFPTLWQLKAENLYYAYPWISLTLILYGLSILFYKRGLLFLLPAFALHSFLLALRIFILGRPPVSNMFETVLYVPWVAVLVSLVFSSSTKIIASSIASMGLLLLLQMTDMNSRLENVQAVLNSQLWLTIHVLMVVGSYGVFLLASILSHFYLLYPSQTLPKQILHTIYLGTALLVAGTLLGGIWAMQSWGRFWDWDPKESWAFISISSYLLLIHSYTFNRIGNLGLARGGVIGFLFITFTWYGVNYILGTGLHSYGFGSGGQVYYYAFIAGELLFLCFARINTPLRQ